MEGQCLTRLRRPRLQVEETVAAGGGLLEAAELRADPDLVGVQAGGKGAALPLRFMPPPCVLSFLWSLYKKLVCTPSVAVASEHTALVCRGRGSRRSWWRSEAEPPPRRRVV